MTGRGRQTTIEFPKAAGLALLALAVIACPEAPVEDPRGANPAAVAAFYATAGGFCAREAAFDPVGAPETPPPPAGPVPLAPRTFVALESENGVNWSPYQPKGIGLDSYLTVVPDTVRAIVCLFEVPRSLGYQVLIPAPGMTVPYAIDLAVSVLEWPSGEVLGFEYLPGETAGAFPEKRLVEFLGFQRRASD